MEDEDAAAAAVTACIDLCDELYNKGFYNAMAEIQDMVNPQSMDISSVVNYAGNPSGLISRLRRPLWTLFYRKARRNWQEEALISVFTSGMTACGTAK